MLDTLVNYTYRNNGPVPNKKIKQAISRVMVETEEEECDAESNANHVTLDTISNDYMSLPTLVLTPVYFKTHCTISKSQGNITNVTCHSTILPSLHFTISP